MSASEVKSRLERDLNATHNAIVALTAERVKLALPAHTGDTEAVLRVVEIRGEIDAKRAGLQDLQQAIADLEPAVKVEQATDRLRQREALHGQYVAVRDEVMDRMEAIDAAILALAEALRAAAGPVEQARHLAVELAVPLGSTGSDIGHLAQQRMIVAQNVGIRSVRDLVETALEDVDVLTRQSAPFPLRSNIRLAEQMRRSLASVEQRVLDALADDRRVAAQSGVLLKPEAA